MCQSNNSLLIYRIQIHFLSSSAQHYPNIPMWRVSRWLLGCTYLHNMLTAFYFRTISHQNSVDTVFLSNSMSQKLLGDQMGNIKEEHQNATSSSADQTPHKLCHYCKHVYINDNVSVISEETHTDWDEFLHSSLGSTTITSSKVNRRMSHDLESLRDHHDNHIGGKFKRHTGNEILWGNYVCYRRKMA